MCVTACESIFERRQARGKSTWSRDSKQKAPGRRLVGEAEVGSEARRKSSEIAEATAFFLAWSCPTSETSRGQPTRIIGAHC